MNKRFLSVLLAIVIVAVSGCGDTKSGAATDNWIDSDIKGSITADTKVSIKDDFAAAANKDTYLSEELRGSAVEEIARTVLRRKRELIDDNSVSGDDFEKARSFVRLAENWDARNSLGISPLEPYLEDIESISNVEELYSFITDTERNPLGVAPVELSGLSRSKVDPSSYFVLLDKKSFTLGDQNSYYDLNANALESMVATEERVTFILSKLNYDEAQIKKILNGNYQIEKKLCDIERELSDAKEEDITCSREELAYVQGDYPLTTYMDNWGYGNCTRFVADIEYIRKLDELCRRSVEELKSMFMVYYILKAGHYLDRDTYDAFTEMEKPRGVLFEPDIRTEEEKSEELIFNDYLGQTALEGALDQMYVNKYISPDSYDRLYRMTEEIIDAYRTIFASEPWLSEEGKKACLEKLNAISIHVIYPDECDYSDLNIKSLEEGGNFLEAYFDVYKFGEMKNAALSAEKFQKDEWNPYFCDTSTTITNSFYSPENNSIYILAGILEAPAYYEGMSEEELLGAIGAIVGHEITHGFDAGGVKYDKYGIENTWLPEEDQNAFADKTAYVSLFYSSLKPFSGSGSINGDMVQTEGTADMGGIRSTLYVAAQKENFDYDLYFRSFAALWATQRSIDAERYYIGNDEHPLAFLRVNVAVSQFDEFIQTYDIKEGDGMYVNPEKRIAVW